MAAAHMADYAAPHSKGRMVLDLAQRMAPEASDTLVRGEDPNIPENAPIPLSILRKSLPSRFADEELPVPAPETVVPGPSIQTEIAAATPGHDTPEFADKKTVIVEAAFEQGAVVASDEMIARLVANGDGNSGQLNGMWIDLIVQEARQSLMSRATPARPEDTIEPNLRPATESQPTNKDGFSAKVAAELEDLSLQMAYSDSIVFA